MATTTNYGWDTPDDTDLVKDGASAIRTLGSSVDTTTKNLNPQTTTGALAYRSATSNVNTALPIGTAGHFLKVNSGGTAPEWAALSGSGFNFIASATPSSSSGQSINNCFTSTYQNYMVIVNIDSVSTTMQIAMRFRASATDTTTNYAYQRLFWNTTASADSNQLGTDEVPLINAVAVANAAGNQAVFYVCSPQLARTTTFLVDSYGNDGTSYGWKVNGVQTASTQFDGLTIYPTTGTYSGTIRVYGIANS